MQESAANCGARCRKFAAAACDPRCLVSPKDECRFVLASAKKASVLFYVSFKAWNCPHASSAPLSSIHAEILSPDSGLTQPSARASPRYPSSQRYALSHLKCFTVTKRQTKASLEELEDSRLLNICSLLSARMWRAAEAARETQWNLSGVKRLSSSTQITQTCDSWRDECKRHQ